MSWDGPMAGVHVVIDEEETNKYEEEAKEHEHETGERT